VCCSSHSDMPRVWPECDTCHVDRKSGSCPFADSYAENDGKPLLETSLSDCVERTQTILEEIDEGKRTLPIVGGRKSAVCGLYYATFRNGAYSMKPTRLACGDAPGFEASASFARADDIVNHSVNLANLQVRPVESLATEAVDAVADHSFTVNKPILLRRLSLGFKKEGREAASS
jgi:hypothetical protein